MKSHLNFKWTLHVMSFLVETYQHLRMYLSTFCWLEWSYFWIMLALAILGILEWLCPDVTCLQVSSIQATVLWILQLKTPPFLECYQLTWGLGLHLKEKFWTSLFSEKNENFCDRSFPFFGCLLIPCIF